MTKKNLKWNRMVALMATLTVGASLCITACSKDEDPETDSGSQGSTVEAVTKHIKKIEAEDGYRMDFEWNGDNLTKIRTYPNGDEYSEEVTFTYEGGKLSKIVVPGDDAATYTYTWSGNRIETERVEYKYEDSYTVRYTYSGGKLATLSSGGETLQIRWSGNNVAQSGDSQFTYDTKNNPLHITAGFMVADDLSTYFFPSPVHFYSASNVVAMTDGEGNSATYTFTYTDEGYPSTMTQTGDFGESTVRYYYYE